MCDECRADILTDPFPTCPKCGRNVGPHADTSASCVGCAGEHFAFERVVRVGPYEGRRRELVLRAKRDELAAECAAALFAEATVATLKVEAPERVCAVPLHWHRAWRRGYNQSAVLARTLAGGLGVAFAARSLKRSRSTPSQTTLTPTARRTNVRGAFRARGRMPGLTVVLVDDVLTSGATADAAARALRQIGVTRVTVAVLARG